MPGDTLPSGDAPLVVYRSRADSLLSVATRAAALGSRDLRVVIDLAGRRFAVLLGADTLRAGPAGVGTGSSLAHGKRVWRFDTPRGTRVVRRKEAEPAWTPPDWHYVEVAEKHGLRLRFLNRARPRALDDTTRLAVRDSAVGVVGPDSLFWPLSPDFEIVFGDTLFVPPIGTANRRIPGILGRHMLDMGDGYLLHGTPEQSSIGRAATHGCVRLRDDDIEWMYEILPVGTAVYIY
jgi:hypothetical protein